MHVPSKWKPSVVTIHNSGVPLLLISASPKRFLAIGANKSKFRKSRREVVTQISETKPDIHVRQNCCLSFSLSLSL